MVFIMSWYNVINVKNDKNKGCNGSLDYYF